MEKAIAIAVAIIIAVTVVFLGVNQLKKSNTNIDSMNNKATETIEKIDIGN